jgi:hypothetical protein
MIILNRFHKKLLSRIVRYTALYCHSPCDDPSITPLGSASADPSTWCDFFYLFDMLRAWIVLDTRSFTVEAISYIWCWHRISLVGIFIRVTHSNSTPGINTGLLYGGFFSGVLPGILTYKGESMTKLYDSSSVLPMLCTSLGITFFHQFCHGNGVPGFLLQIYPPIHLTQARLANRPTTTVPIQ